MLEGINNEIYYTPKEIAQLLGVSDRSIYAYIRDGKLKATRYRMREKLISEKELQIFLQKYWQL